MHQHLVFFKLSWLSNWVSDTFSDLQSLQTNSLCSLFILSHITGSITATLETEGDSQHFLTLLDQDQWPMAMTITPTQKMRVRNIVVWKVYFITPRMIKVHNRIWSFQLSCEELVIVFLRRYEECLDYMDGTQNLCFHVVMLSWLERRWLLKKTDVVTHEKVRLAKQNRFWEKWKSFDNYMRGGHEDNDCSKCCENCEENKAQAVKHLWYIVLV